jgi:hypothetical protein
MVTWVQETTAAEEVENKNRTPFPFLLTLYQQDIRKFHHITTFDEYQQPYYRHIEENRVPCQS